MPKKLLIVITTMLLLVSFCIPAFAYYDFSEGRPTELKPGRDSGYYIWHDRHGWHLFTSSGVPKHFAGVIRTDGEIGHFRSENTEWRQDKIKTDLKRDTISFKFRSGPSVDGLSFRVKNSNYIHFDLYVDGKRVDPSLIHIGRDNWHPAKSNFTIRS